MLDPKQTSSNWVYANKQFIDDGEMLQIFLIVFVAVGDKKFLLRKYSYKAYDLLAWSDTNKPFPIKMPLNEILSDEPVLPSTIAFAVYGMYIPWIRWNNTSIRFTCNIECSILEFLKSSKPILNSLIIISTRISIIVIIIWIFIYWKANSCWWL